MRGRWLGVGVVAMLALGALTGCGRPPSGYTGVSVDQDGNPVIVLAWCGRPPKQIVVNEEPIGPSDPPSLKALVLRAPALSGHDAAVNLVHPTDGWTITDNSLAIDNAVATYVAYGQTDSPDDTSSVEFTKDDLVNLTSADVLGTDDDGGSQVISYEDFTTAVTSHC